MNHRVNVASNHAELEARTVHTLLPVAKAYNLTLIDFSGEPRHHGNPNAKVILTNAYGYYTDPAPISPTDQRDSNSAYTVLASTARGMWASRREVSADGEMVSLAPGDDLVMAPFMSTGVRLCNPSILADTDLTWGWVDWVEYGYETVLGAHETYLPVQVQPDGGQLRSTHHQREDERGRPRRVCEVVPGNYPHDGPGDECGVSKWRRWRANVAGYLESANTVRVRTLASTRECDKAI